MPPSERLRLEYVLEIASALEAVILRSFGPEGGQVLFTRDTGQAMLSRSGTRILSALHLEHPLARMVVECVWKHSRATGDGSKTFILLLASLLRRISKAISREHGASHTYGFTDAAKAAAAPYLANKLLEFISSDLEDLIAVNVVPYGFCVSFEDFTTHRLLVASFFHTRVSHVHCNYLSELTCQMLNRWKHKSDLPCVSLQFLSDNFPALHTPVSGFPVSSSRLIEGQVIHRDFATPRLPNKQQPVKAVVFTDYMQPVLLSPGDVLKVGCGGGVTEENTMVHFSAWIERTLESVIAKLQSLGVSLLLSAVKQSDAALALATQAHMSLVECVSEEELSLFVQLSGVTPVSRSCTIQAENVAALTFCRPILLGAHRYVHVGFCEATGSSKVNPCSLVICGPGEEQTDQYICAIRDAVCMLMTTWEPKHTSEAAASHGIGQSNKSSASSDMTTQSTANEPYVLKKCVLEPGWVIPAGGTFEFLLSKALLNPSSDTLPSVSQLLANALLSVPRQIYSHSPKLFLQAQTRIMSSVQSPSNPLRLKQSMSGSMVDLGLESVACKCQLILAVVQCATSVLRVDTLLHTHTALHTQSKKRTNSSQESTEDEEED